MNGFNGRNRNGQFAVGNAGGPGNPHAAKTAKLRAKMLETVTESDIAEIIATLISMAKSGDLTAIGMLLDRVLGKPLMGIAVATMEQEQEKPLNQISIEERRKRLLAIMDRLMERTATPNQAIEEIEEESRIAPEPGIRIVQREDFYGNNAHELERTQMVNGVPVKMLRPEEMDQEYVEFVRQRMLERQNATESKIAADNEQE